MGKALLKTLGISLLAAIVLIVASDLPYLGSIVNLPGLNWVIWIGVWAWLADRFVREARSALSNSDNPSVPAMGAGALLGLTSGLAGQLLQLAIQGVIMAVAANSAARTGSVVASAVALGSAASAFGSLIAIVVYPAFGAFWGGLFGLVWGMRVRQAGAAHSVTPPAQTSPQ